LEVKSEKVAALLIAVVMAAGVARGARAQTVEEEQAAEDLRQASAASKRHRAELMKIPHVKVVTGEIDSRHDAAILVQVDDQKYVDAVTRQLPPKIEGFPVEVEDSETIVTPGFYVHGKPSEAASRGEEITEDGSEAAKTTDVQR
jgi:hypothetical protein